jgi:hypothetical protein
MGWRSALNFNTFSSLVRKRGDRICLGNPLADESIDREWSRPAQNKGREAGDVQ